MHLGEIQTPVLGHVRRVVASIRMYCHSRGVLNQTALVLSCRLKTLVDATTKSRHGLRMHILDLFFQNFVDHTLLLDDTQARKLLRRNFHGIGRSAASRYVLHGQLRRQQSVR